MKDEAGFIEFNFNDQHVICLNSRIKEFEGSVSQTIVCRGRRGNCGKSEVVWSNQRFGHPSLSFIYPGFQCARSSMLCNMYGGEILNKFAFGDSERSPPHLFLYMPLFKRKTKVKTRRDSTGFNTRESKLY